MEIAKLESDANENNSNAGLNQVKQDTEVAKAAKLRTEADKNVLDFVQDETGVKQERDKELMLQQAVGNIALEKVKSANNKEASQTKHSNDVDTALIRSFLQRAEKAANNQEK